MTILPGVLSGPNTLPGVVGQPEPRRGIIRSIIEETARDVIGAGRTAVAPIGSLFELLGANVPVSIDDLSSRDLKGAATVVSMVVGGMAPKLLGRLLPALSRFITPAAEAGFVGRARAAFLREAVVGAAFGGSRSLLGASDQSALSTILQDSLAFAGFGAGFSLIRSATIATLRSFGGVTAAVESMAAYERAQRLNSVVQKVNEFAGVTLENAAGTRVTVFRDPTTGKLNRLVEMGTKVQRVKTDSTDFGAELASLVNKGYTRRRTSGLQKDVSEYFRQVGGEGLEELVKAGYLKPEDLRLIREANPDAQMLREVDLLEIRSFVQAASRMKAAKVEVERMMQDLISPRNGFGVPIQLGKRNLEEIASQVIGAPARWTKGGALRVDDPKVAGEIVEEGLRQGIISFRTLSAGLKMDEAMRWLHLGVVPKDFFPQFNPRLPTAMLRILSGSTIARHFPKIAPWLEESKSRMLVVEHLNEKLHVELSGFRDEVVAALGRPFNKAEERAIKEVFDNASEEALLRLNKMTVKVEGEDLPFTRAYGRLSEIVLGKRKVKEEEKEVAMEVLQDLNRLWMNEANLLIRENLSRKGPAFAAAANFITNFFERNFELLRESGLIALGRPGYFPIFNRGEWVANVTTRDGKVKVLGFYKSLAEAREAVEGEIKSGVATQGLVRPGRTFYEGRSANLRPKQFKLVQDLEAQMQTIRITSSGAMIFGERKLGLRNWEDVGIFEALTLYGMSVNKRLAFSRLPSSLLNPNSPIYDSILDGFLSQTAVKERLLAETYERSSEEIWRQIPARLNSLANWVRTLESDILGIPRGAELVLDTLLQQMGVAPGKARSYLGFVRMIENSFRLGGLGSAPMQISQLIINLSGEMGTGKTLNAVRKFVAREKGWGLSEILQDMKEAGVRADFIASFAMDPRAKEFQKAVADAAASSGVISKATIRLLRDKTTWERMYMLSLYPFFTSEKLVRAISFKAAMEDALKRGLTRAEALAEGKQVMFKTQFDYHIADMPEILRSPVFATIFQFKSFFIKELEFIARLSPKQRAEMVAVMTALGGIGSILNIPGPDLLDMAAGHFFGKKVEESLKVDGLDRIGIPSDSTLNDLIVYGLGGAIGVDMSDRISLGGWGDMLDGWSGPVITDSKEVLRFVTTTLWDGLVNGHVDPQNLSRFVRRVMPSDLRRIFTSYQIVKEGEVREAPVDALLAGYPVTRTLYRAEERWDRTAPIIGKVVDAVTPFLGTPVPAKREYLSRQVFRRAVDRYRAGYTGFARDAAAALLAGKKDEAQAILQEARSRGYPISNASLRYHIKLLQMTPQELRRRMAPRALRDREELQSLFEATGHVPSPFPPS